MEGSWFVENNGMHAPGYSSSSSNSKNSSFNSASGSFSGSDYMMTTGTGDYLLIIGYKMIALNWVLLSVLVLGWLTRGQLGTVKNASDFGSLENNSATTGVRNDQMWCWDDDDRGNGMDSQLKRIIYCNDGPLQLSVGLKLT